MYTYMYMYVCQIQELHSVYTYCMSHKLSHPHVHVTVHCNCNLTRSFCDKYSNRDRVCQHKRALCDVSIHCVVQQQHAMYHRDSHISQPG